MDTLTAARRVVLAIILIAVVTGGATGAVLAQSDEPGGNETDGGDEDDVSEDEASDAVGMDVPQEVVDAVNNDSGDGGGGTEQAGGGSGDGNELSNESGGDGGGGSDDGTTQQVGTGDIGPDMSVSGNAEKLANWFGQKLVEGIEVAVDDVFNNMMSTYAPENDGYRGVLGEPAGGDYAEAYSEVYMGIILPLILMGIVLVATIQTLLFMPIQSVMGKPWWILIGKAVIGVCLVVISYEIASVMQHISNEVTMFLLPSGEDITSGMDLGESPFEEGNAEGISGPLAILIGLYFSGGTSVVALLLIHGTRQIIMFFAPFFLGVVLLMMYFGPKPLRATGSVAFWQYVGLNVMNWPTAMFLAIAYRVTFDFGLPGGAGQLANLGVTMGLFFLAVAIPVLVQGTFLGGSIAAIIVSGSVTQAAGDYVDKKSPWGSSDDSEASGPKDGEEYPKSSSYGDDSSRSRNNAQKRKQTAEKSRSGSRRGAVMADGGTQYDSTPDSPRTTENPKRPPASDSGSDPRRGSSDELKSRRRAFYESATGNSGDST